MRFKRDYSAFLKRKWDWLVSRFKPLTIHTEAIFIDEVWEKIKERVKKGDVKKWYVMTPENYDLYKSSFNVKIPKEKLSKIMKARYKWMIENGQKLELHVHLSLTMNKMSYSEQEKIIGNAIRWMKQEIEVTPREFVPGWWSYDENTLKVLKKYGLKMIYPRDYDYGHDYEWELK